MCLKILKVERFLFSEWILGHQFRMDTLQGINISHPGKRKLIFKTALERDMLVPRRVLEC